MPSAEGGFRSALVKELRALGAFVQPIESGTTASGIPDLYLAFEWGYSCWVELKAMQGVSWPAARKVGFRPGQRAWLSRHARTGNHSFVAVRYANAVVTQGVMDLEEDTDRMDMTRPMLIQPKRNAKEWLEWLAQAMTG